MVSIKQKATWETEAAPRLLNYVFIIIKLIILIYLSAFNISTVKYTLYFNTSLSL